MESDMKTITVHSTWVEQFQDFRDKLEESKKEYEGLGLSEQQIIIAMSYGLSPTAIKNIRVNWAKLYDDLEKAFDSIANLTKGVTDSLSNFTEEIQKQETVKGKKIKPWEKKKFYQ